MRVRVCMICSFFYPVIGGSETQARDLSRELIKKGVSVCVLTQRLEGSPSEEKLDGMVIYRAIRSHRWRIVCGLRYFVSTFLFLWKKRREYDVIHTHVLCNHTLVAVLISKMFRKKVVAKLACGGEFGELERLKKVIGARILSTLCKQVDRFVAVSNEIKEELTALGIDEEHIAHIPNFVDTDTFRPVLKHEKNELRKKLSLPVDKKIVTCIGRLTPQKGISYVINAWPHVHHACPDSLLLIFGKGELGRELRERVNRRGLADSVVFQGVQSDVSEYLKVSTLFVLHSLGEGLSNSLLEAMACGLPCIATRIGGTVDVINDGMDGILVGPRHSGEVAGELIRLLTDEEALRALGARAREKIEGTFAYTVVVPMYLRLYWEVLSVGQYHSG